jgi:hypothetical protein
MSVISLYLLQFEDISYYQTKLTYIIYFNLTTYFDSMCASSSKIMKFIRSHVYSLIKIIDNGYFNFTFNPIYVDISIFYENIIIIKF